MFIHLVRVWRPPKLFARQAARVSGQIRQAFAAPKAFLQEQEDQGLSPAGKSLTELEGIGRFLDRRIREWLNNPRYFLRERNRKL
jgi:hypothetical protein